MATLKLAMTTAYFYFFSLGQYFGAGFWACFQFLLPSIQPVNAHLAEGK